MRGLIKGAALLGVGVFAGYKIFMKSFVMGLTVTPGHEENVKKLVKALYDAEPEVVKNVVFDEVINKTVGKDSFEDLMNIIFKKEEA